METRAKAKFIKVSPSKIRLVASPIKGLDVAEALTKLQFINKSATGPLTKLIKSAIANAEENHKLQKDNLFIKEINVDDGPTTKRWRPRAFGRATPIRKRSSHIVLVLSERVPTIEKKEKVKREDKKDDLVKVDSMDELKALDIDRDDQEDTSLAEDGESRREEKRSSDRPTKNTKQGKKGFINKIFNRKSGDK